jgi:alpha-L-fucosidase
MAYEPTLDSLNAHPVPDWYRDAKFGIFIHWGLFSVPAYASGTARISETFRAHYWSAVARTPYTEWYWNAIKVRGSASAANHKAFWRDMPYEDFRGYFHEGLKRWDPQAWADLFTDAGARYVVLVTKHHDGYCLWPSAVRNPHIAGWASERDIVGELAEAVCAKGLKFGVYYSGGIDWSFQPRPLRTLGDFIGSVPGGAYPAYAEAQMRELIARYRPSILWNDISWPAGPEPMLKLFADYYNSVADGVVNDRWSPFTKANARLRKPLARALFDVVAWVAVKLRGAPEGVTPPLPPHCDFRTPEYTAFKTVTTKKWESTRGMSHSFGYNRMDTDKSYDSAETLIRDFVDAVSKNGNLLLNVGPRGSDAQIPDEQATRLRAFGAWLGANGEGIYGARPWDCAQGTATGGGQRIALRFTAKPHTLYVFLMETPAPGISLLLSPDAAALPTVARVTHLESGETVAFEQTPDGLALTLPRALAPAAAHGVRLDLAAG